MGMVTTTVQIPEEDYAFLKNSGVKMRSAIRAGITHLKGAEDRAKLQLECDRLRGELVRMARHKDMVFYIFEKYPEIYKEARKVAE